VRASHREVDVRGALRESDGRAEGGAEGRRLREPKGGYGTYGDLIGVEHHVVGEAAVVHEGDLLTRLHRQGGGLEDERAGVGAQLDGARLRAVGQQGEGQGGGRGGL
jgi:hypothetical protein